MKPLAKATSCWLFLLLISGLGGCQRASYSFQARRTFYEMPAPRPADSLAASPVANELGRTYTTEKAGFFTSLRRRGHKVRSQPLTSRQKQAKVAGLQLAGRQVRKVAAAYARLRQPPEPPTEPVRFRSRGIALLLAFFLGGLGAHLFYLGYHGRGTAYLVGSATAVFLLLIGFIAAIGTILGGGTSGLGFLTAGVVLASIVSVLATIDILLILINSLKPKNGDYYPRFFQTRPSNNEPTR